MSDDIEATLSGTADQTIRVPANLMSLIRQSYDTREKVLDWCLALGCIAAMAWFFRSEIRTCFYPDVGPNAGLDDPIEPSQDVAGAFPASERRPDLYTYNMPSSRTRSSGPGPSGIMPPGNPSLPPEYDA